MPRVRRAAVLVLVATTVGAVPAAAHQGNPNYRSVVRKVVPAHPGLQVRVLGFDNQLELTNRTGKVVVVEGYDGEPYARLRPDGTVEVNRRSPATYLNDDRFGRTTVPPWANPKRPPQWRVVAQTGRFVWHDHRMHWMSGGLPPQVRNKSRRTKIFDYRIPLTVDGRPASVRGTLLWVGTPSRFPLPALVALLAIVLVAVVWVLLVRVRRRAGSRSSGDAVREAW